MAAVLHLEGWSVNRQRAKRLMKVMGIEALYQKPNTGKGHPDRKIYPYLLRGMSIDRPHRVWCADITYTRGPGTRLGAFPNPSTHEPMHQVLDP